jgi:hypothetical protein
MIIQTKADRKKKQCGGNEGSFHHLSVLVLQMVSV